MKNFTLRQPNFTQTLVDLNDFRTTSLTNSLSFTPHQPLIQIFLPTMKRCEAPTPTYSRKQKFKSLTRSEIIKFMTSYPSPKHQASYFQEHGLSSASAILPAKSQDTRQDGVLAVIYKRRSRIPTLLWLISPPFACYSILLSFSIWQRAALTSPTPFCTDTLTNRST